MDNEYIYLLKEIRRLALTSPNAIGYQALTVDSTVGGLSLTIPDGATYAEFVMESSATGIVARYLHCGGSTGVPTSTAGLALSPLDRFDITNAENLTNFRIIQAQAGTHKLHVQYYKHP